MAARGAHAVEMPGPVVAMAFGRYGREDSTLVSVFANGGLDIKFIPRHNPLANGHVHTTAENVKPLEIPKKTKIFVELTQVRALCDGADWEPRCG